MSHRVMKEKPKKRPRVPPNSATNEERGKISSSVLTSVLLDTAQREKVKLSDLKDVRFLSPTMMYFLYLQGFIQPVILVISLGSAVLSDSNILSYFLEKFISFLWNFFCPFQMSIHRRDLYTCIVPLLCS